MELPSNNGFKIINYKQKHNNTGLFRDAVDWKD